ncbi:MAG TPA: hypothetical protein VK892_21550, partial [Pyrinomonadaceae bacterium]|nr:hypothetical protein [Pyrinomonadaceae bacterium]
IEGAHGGFSSVDGMAKISAAGIVLEFEAKVFGIMKTGIKEVRVPVREIERLKFKKSWFKTTLEIWLNNFQTLSEIPSKDGRIILKIAKEDREAAEQSAQLLEKSFSEYKEELPPPHTPVSRLFKEDEFDTSELKDE